MVQSPVQQQQQQVTTVNSPPQQQQQIQPNPIVIPQQNVQSPLQQQNTTSPRVLQPSGGTIIGNVTQSITSPLPTSSLLSQNLISIENKTMQLQQLNKDIYQLIKLITPPNNCNNINNNSNSNNNYNNNNSPPTTPTQQSYQQPFQPLQPLQQPDLAEYNKNVQLLNQYRIKVQSLIKEIQQDLNNQNLPLFFLSPVLNDEHQQDSLFYDPFYPNQLPPPPPQQQSNETTDTMQIDSTTTSTLPETLDQHNQRMFLEKFKRQLTPETTSKQNQEWDTEFKDREKLIKNIERVKLTIFK